MKHIYKSIIYIIIFVSGLVLAGKPGFSGTDAVQPLEALLLRVHDAIGPATSDYLLRGLDTARDRGAHLVVVELDTPGGLDTSMREINQAILGSLVPVVIFVSPAGARAASAGTYMLYAAHIAAMAPGTNLGAATPVQLGGLPDLEPERPPKPGADENKTENRDQADDTVAGASHRPKDAMGRKMVNDAVAYIRSLAELRGRNADWAELAVREAASLSSSEALARAVIDVVAEDMNDLLQQLDGWTVMVANNQEVQLSTADLKLQSIEPDWRNRLLAVITNPNIAYILMLLGIYGLFFELANPGFVLPGVIGAISLLLALYAMQVLPVNFAGLALILLGIAFMVVELFVPSFGALGIGGVLAFVIGSIILFDTETGAIPISLPLIAAVSILSAAFFLIAIRAIFNAHKKPVVSGQEELLGSIGVVMGDFQQGRGRVHIHGESWQATSDHEFAEGEKVRVAAIEGLTLIIAPVDEEKRQ